MSLEAARELEDKVSSEIPVLERSADEFRTAVAGYVENHSPAEEKDFPRYIGEPVSQEELLSAAQYAPFSMNFIDLRMKQVDYALKEMDETDEYRVQSGDGGVLTGKEAVNALRSSRGRLKQVNGEFREVAEFLQEFGDIPVVDVKERMYYKLAGPTMEMDDLEWPREHYWPFSDSTT